ncbi:MAG: endonuclease/exonuclease/phosphatase family protein [Treponema sp.]|jgi:endonuclease/exonuclease/phosphatase family metal-dependent hydrolase|nr:endonuclease/exonuclease/phosphatase family protein [Treponema sp.]
MKKHKVYRRAAPLLLAFAAMVSGCAFSGSGGGEEAGTGQKEGGGNSSVSIMTWNLQALFDGVENGNEYDEYREGAGWSNEKYSGRLNNIAAAIGKIEPSPPDIIAIQEIESAQVLKDLAAALSGQAYVWTHFAANPEMSLGLGVLSRLPLDGIKVHSVNIDGEAAPRPVLEARVSSDGGEFALFVCHWKSKLGGEEATEAARRSSARIILRRIRELAEAEPELPVIVMGDLNENYDEFYRRSGAAISALLPDDPRSAELAGLYVPDRDGGALADELQKDFFIISRDKPPAPRCFPQEAVAFYSPWTGELENGSYYYKNEWETIDHFLLSRQLFDGAGWEFENSALADYQPFVNSGGHPAAYNPRTGSGLSDHLPLLLFLSLRGS